MEGFVKATVEKRNGESITLEYNTRGEHPIEDVVFYFNKLSNDEKSKCLQLLMKQ